MDEIDAAGIAAGLDDAIAYVRGDTSRGRIATVDVGAVRSRTALSQGRFAEAFGFAPAPCGTRNRDGDDRTRDR